MRNSIAENFLFLKPSSRIFFASNTHNSFFNLQKCLPKTHNHNILSRIFPN